MKDIEWYCSNCQKINKLDSELEKERHLFGSNSDNIFCTVNGEPETLHRRVNNLHIKLEFTMEIPDENDNLAFLDMNINVNERYKKPTDTGVVLNFCSCAPIQIKKNIVEVTVHRVFRSTSTCQDFDRAPKENMKIFG